MLSQLSYWPWIIGAAVSFVAAAATTKRTIGEVTIDPGDVHQRGYRSDLLRFGRSSKHRRICR